MTGESNATAPPEAPGRRTLRLDLQYDGGGFSGWQVQPGERSVQGELERALRRILDEPEARVVGAGRTDSGAHAAGQVAHVRTRSRIAPESLRAGLNSALDGDLRVVSVIESCEAFHARYSALGKEYRYHVWHGSPVPPFLRGYVYAVHGRLDVEAMNRAARLLVGTHDLTSFRSAHCSARSPVRSIDAAVVGGEGSLAVFAIAARSFLQHMVRILAGTLVRIGRGQLGEQDLVRIREARDRRLAPATAPAQGLWLVRIRYPGQNEPLAAIPEPMLKFWNHSI